MTENINTKNCDFSITASFPELPKENKDIDIEEHLYVISKITEKEEIDIFGDN